MSVKLTQNDILSIVPHRFENVLIDEAECGGSECTAKLTIAENDPAGRDIFLRTDGPTRSVLEHAAAEYLALAAVCQLGDLGEGRVGFFSTITNFRRPAKLPAGEPLAARLERQRDRAAFRRFKGKVFDAQGTEAASADIMAFILDTRAERAQDHGRQEPLPATTQSVEVTRHRYFWKRPEMCFISECRHLDLQARKATLRCVYPADHPFTKGHFPGNPVMMGITQWIAASDALDWLVFAMIEAGQLSSSAEVPADALLQRADGTVVADVAGLTNRYQRGADGRIASETIATKRIGFRDMVRPGEELLCGVSICPAS